MGISGDDELHEARVMIGEAAMQLSEAIGEEVLVRIAEATRALERAYYLFREQGMDRGEATGAIFGMMGGILGGME